MNETQGNMENFPMKSIPNQKIITPIFPKKIICMKKLLDSD